MNIERGKFRSAPDRTGIIFRSVPGGLRTEHSYNQSGRIPNTIRNRFKQNPARTGGIIYKFEYKNIRTDSALNRPDFFCSESRALYRAGFNSARIMPDRTGIIFRSVPGGLRTEHSYNQSGRIPNTIRNRFKQNPARTGGIIYKFEYKKCPDGFRIKPPGLFCSESRALYRAGFNSAPDHAGPYRAVYQNPPGNRGQLSNGIDCEAVKVH